MSELTDKLRLSALEVSSRLEASGEQGIADLLSEAADQIEILNDSEMRWIGRISDIRAALGCFEKPMLSELREEVVRVRAYDHLAGLIDGLEEANELAGKFAASLCPVIERRIAGLKKMRRTQEVRP
jgi:hypothetical protein